MSVFTNSHPGFDKDWFLMRWQKTLEQLEEKLKGYEESLTELTKNNANMQKTIIMFVKREKQLVTDLNQVKIDTREKDTRIKELESKVSDLNLRDQRLIEENLDIKDKNDNLIRKFN